MKHTLIVSLMIAVFLTLPVYALDGRIVVVTAGEAPGSFAPVALPYDGPAPEGRIDAVNQATGDIAPATVDSGWLRFVPPALAANQEQRFELNVRDEADTPRVRLEHDAEAGTVAVYVRDAHLTTYNFGEKARVPYLWPVYGEGDVTITRNYPMAEDSPLEGRKDHRHHVSIWTAFGDVNGFDTWHRAPINTQGVYVASGDAFGVIRAHHVWCNNQGEPLVDEIREYRFYDGPEGIRLIDQIITFNAVYGEVVFGDNKEGLVAFRVRPELQGNEGGVLTNWEGKQGERDVYGTPGPWMDYSGQMEGVGNRGIALFSHPSNFRDPCWHVRNYGLFAANPFALSDVAKLGEDGSHTLPEGESMTLRYRLYVHSGDVEEAAVAQRYADYADGAQAAWAE